MTREERLELEKDCEIVSIKPHGVEAKQIDGTHYLNKIQPWDIIDSWGLNFYEGNILKYLLRSKDNRVVDLKKLIHYAEKLIEIEERAK